MLLPHYKVPDFLCLGVRKSATSWVCSNLITHPEVCIPKKEIDFFNKHYSNGFRWYASLFENCGDKITGELTPDYIYYKDLPVRIKKMNPKVKLFLILRNPVHRAFSQWKFGMFLGHIPTTTSFIKLWTDDHLFIRTRGHYSEQIINYKKYFNDSQFKVYIYDDILINPLAFMVKIYRYLGINDKFTPPLLHERYYPTGKTERPKEFINFARNFVLNPQDAEVLKKYYDKWTDKTSALIGRDLSSWKL